MLRRVASDQAELDGLKPDLDGLVREGARAGMSGPLTPKRIFAARLNGRKRSRSIGEVNR